MQPKSPPTLLEKIKGALNKDPKRTAVMAGLAIMMIGLWGRMWFNGPSSATASFIRRSVAAITESSAGLSRPASSNPLMDWLALPKKSIQRNLFAVHLDFYAKAAGHPEQSGASEDPAKSSTDDADQNREKQILLENLQTQAAKLKLQTTMMGSTPRAMLNGELVKEGDTVEGFMVLKIEPRKVTVQQDEVTLEIAMP